MIALISLRRSRFRWSNFGPVTERSKSLASLGLKLITLYVTETAVVLISGSFPDALNEGGECCFLNPLKLPWPTLRHCRVTRTQVRCFGHVFEDFLKGLG